MTSEVRKLFEKVKTPQLVAAIKSLNETEPMRSELLTILESRDKKLYDKEFLDTRPKITFDEFWVWVEKSVEGSSLILNKPQPLEDWVRCLAGWSRGQAFTLFQSR